MSTTLTDSAADEPAMVDSLSLRLVFALEESREAILRQVSARLLEKGYDVSPATLGFLGQLDCGPNWSAELARRLGVSRQMVHKTVRSLVARGYLALEDDPARGRQKIIRFTETGTQLMAEARQALRDLDAVLATRLGAQRLETALATLQQIAAETDAPSPGEGGSGRAPQE